MTNAVTIAKPTPAISSPPPGTAILTVTGPRLQETLMRPLPSRPLATLRIVRVALLTATLAPFPALADPVQVDRLRTLFEDHLGHPPAGEPSAVAVTQVGGDYEVAVDLDRLAAPLKALGLDAKLGRDVFRLTPKQDGTWAWRSDGFEPWSWSAAGQTGKARFEGWRGEGVFDPALSAFRSQTLKVDQLISEQSIPPAGDTPRVTIVKTDRDLDLTTSAAPAASGTGVDATFTQTTKAGVETFSLTEGVAKGIPDMEATLKVASTKIDGTVAGFRSEPFFAMWRHLVAHHGPDDFKAGQAALKAKIADLGPLFEKLHESASADGIELETPVGFGSLGRVAVSLDTTGATEEGEVDFTLALSGLEMHSLFIPGWAARLIPTDVTLHGKATGWNAASALAAVLEKADFAAAKPLSDEAGTEIRDLFLPDGTVEIDLAGNRVHSSTWDLTLEGHLTAGADGAEGSITVRGVGLDAAANALRDPKAGPDAAKAADAIGMAISLAEPRDGALYWRFDFDGKAISVNGHGLTGDEGGTPTKTDDGAAEKKSTKKANQPAGTSTKK